MPRVTLTNALVNDATHAAAPPCDVILWDDAIRGLGLLHKASRSSKPHKAGTGGSLFWIVAWREPSTGAHPGKGHRMTLGRPGVLDLKAARAAAIDQLRRATDKDAPVNPLAVRKAAKAATLAAPTVAMLIAEYRAHSAWLDKAPSTKAGDRIRHGHMIAALGGVRVRDLDDKAIAEFRRKVTDPAEATKLARSAHAAAVAAGTARRAFKEGCRRGGDGAARRVMRDLASLLSFAVKRKHIAVNPLAGVEIGGDGQREDVPSRAEYARLWAVIAELRGDSPTMQAALDVFAIIMATGARRSEIGRLRSRHLSPDLTTITLGLGEHKAGHAAGKGKAKVKVIPLPRSARAILAGYARGEPDAFVFAGKFHDVPVSLAAPWARVAAAAGLPGPGQPGRITLHNLRHGVGTALKDAGASVAQIADQLGHRSLRTAERYMHATPDAGAERAQWAENLVRPSPVRAVGGE